MKDNAKASKQLSTELESLRQKISKLEAAQAEHKRLDRALKDSETRYRRLFETAQDAIVILDGMSGQVIDATPSVIKLLGYSLEELLGKNLWEIGAFKDIEESKTIFQKLQDKKHVHYEHLSLETRDGRLIDVELVSNKYRIDHKDIIQCTIRDITERKKIEEELQSKEHLYRSLFENIMNGFAYCKMLFDKDQPQDFIYLAVNSAFETQTGLKNVIGKRVSEVIPGIRESDPQLFEIYGRVALTGIPETFETYVDALGAWFSLSVFSPEKEYFVAVFDVITERKRAEEKIRESEEKYRRLVEQANDGICIIQDGLVKYANMRLAEIYGGSVEEIVNIPFSDFIHPDEVPKVIDRYKRRMAGEQVPQIYETVLNLKDGSTIYSEFNVAIISYQGQPAEMVVVRDLTERKSIEKALAESEEKYKALVESSLTGVFILQDDRYVYTNDKFAQMHGYTKEELAGIHFLELTHPDDRELTRERTDKRLKGEQFSEPIVRHRLKKDGQSFWAEVIGTTIDYRGKPAVMGNLVDITERKSAEEELSESEEKYKALVESSLTGIFVLQDDRYVYTNTKFAQMHGYTKEELVGIHFSELTHPDSRELARERVDKRLKGEQFSSIIRHRLKKGGEDFWAVLSATTIDYRGKPAVMGNFLDITETKYNEEQLNLKAQLLDNATDFILLHNYVEDLDLVYVNETVAVSLGYSKEELMKMKLHQLITPEYANLMSSRLQALHGKGIHIFESAYLRKDGSAMPIEVRARTFELGNKKFILSSARDITERKRLEAERKEMELKAQVTARLASVGELAAGIAHEINNPLTGVIGYAELLQGQEDVPAHIKKDLETIHQGAQRVADIVRRLLTFARQTKPMRDYVNIQELIQNTLELRAYQLRTGNIEVITEFDPNLPITVADGGQLQQVFLNLIANAEMEMQVAHGRGKLLIKTQKLADTILISFEDDGPGISKENMGKLFSPFFTTKEVGKGTGLGLAICHGIVAEHGGRIWAENKHGKGATFFVELPIVMKPEQLKMDEPDSEETTKVETAKILVVDDEEVIREFLSRVLREQGHQVDATDNAEEALTKIKTTQYRLILLDIKMPGMSGMELYKRIQKISKSLAGRVVFVTGDVMAQDTAKFLEKTKAPYITKPFDAKRLTKELQRLLNR